jgi:Alcohol acetyltransferase
MMGASIQNETFKDPDIVRLHHIDLRQLVKFVKLGQEDDQDLDGSGLYSFVEDAHQVPFKFALPLPAWRVVVADNGRANNTIEAMTKGVLDPSKIYVGFFFHHGLFDGSSGASFHSQFLNAWNHIHEKNAIFETSPLIDIPILNPPPPLESIHPLPASKYFITKNVVRVLMPTTCAAWTGPPITADKNRTCLRTIFLNSNNVEALLRMCRQHQVTMSALLHVMIARTLAACYPEHDKFNCTAAVDFRRFLRRPRFEMAVYVDSLDHKFSARPSLGHLTCGGEFSWEVVKKCKKEIDQGTIGPENRAVTLLKFLNDPAGFLRGTIGQKRSHTFEVSNLGVLDATRENYQPHSYTRISRVLFTQSSNVTGAAFVFGVATAQGKGISISLTWQEDIIEAGDARKVIRLLKEQLIKLSETVPANASNIENPASGKNKSKHKKRLSIFSLTSQ